MKYKNISETTQIIRKDKVKPGEILETNEKINNKNFKEVKEAKK